MLVLVAGVDPQVNKFEKVSSDDHQLSVVAGGVGPTSGIWGGGDTHVPMHHG